MGGAQMYVSWRLACPHQAAAAERAQIVRASSWALASWYLQRLVYPPMRETGKCGWCEKKSSDRVSTLHRCCFGSIDLDLAP